MLSLPSSNPTLPSAITTIGPEDYNRLRPLSYRGVDVFILAFSLISKASYENVSKKWIQELKHYALGVPIILVRTKLGQILFLLFCLPLISRRWLLSCPWNGGRGGVVGCGGEVVAKGVELRKLIGASAFIECSSKTQQNVKAVFDQAIKVVLQPPKQKKKKSKAQKACSIS
ncbi:hypothetical protein Droror1_Dr00002890 [Drosera rotundifolia]